MAEASPPADPREPVRHVIRIQWRPHSAREEQVVFSPGWSDCHSLLGQTSAVAPQQFNQLRGQEESSPRAGGLELTDHKTRAQLGGLRTVSNSLHCMCHLQRRRIPIQCVAAMEGGLGVWLQTASGIVPIGPAGFRSPSVLGLAVQTRAARPPLVPGSRRVLVAALLLMLTRDFVRSRASVEELILAAGLPPRLVRAVRTATEMAAIAFRVELRDCRGVTAGRPDGRLLSSGIRRFR